jgi:hypothetical protein
MRHSGPNDPAFPSVLSPEEWAEGMSVREYFAAKALQGLLASRQSIIADDDYQLAARYAAMAVMMADALVVALGAKS